MTEGFATFDHTGDLGLEVWAATPERLFELAAVALMAQIALAADDPRREVTAHVEIEGADPEDLMVHWLNTALLQAELRRAVWVEVQTQRLTRTCLTAVLAGPALDPARHVLLREVKAVSHHDQKLQLEPPDCRARLILDI